MNKEFAKDIEACVKVLRQGGTILYPTDTVWGLGCDPTNEEAVKKIIQMKNRPANKSFIVLVNSFEMLKEFVPQADEKITAYLSSVKKPTTVIYTDAAGFAPSVFAADGSAAIRICHDDFCQELIAQFGMAVLSTSANKSGDAAPRIFRELNPAIIEETDYTAFYRRNDANLAAPSTIIQWVNNEIKIIRK